MTLDFEMVISAGKVADLQRVGVLSSLGEFSIYLYVYCEVFKVAVDVFSQHFSLARAFPGSARRASRCGKTIGSKVIIFKCGLLEILTLL